MAEYKPRHDDQFAGDAKANKPGLTRDPAKLQGDKLRDAVEEAANRKEKSK
jgi:hypothetical protein